MTMDRTSWYQGMMKESSLGCGGDDLDISKAKSEIGQVPMIIFPGSETYGKASHGPQDSLGSNLDEWDGSSRITTPPLSDASVRDDDSDIQEPSLDGLGTVLENVPIKGESNLTGCKLNHEVDYDSLRRDNRLHIKDTEAHCTEPSQPLGADAGDHNRQPSTFTTFADDHSQDATIQDLLFDALEFPDHPERRQFFPQTTFTQIMNEKVIQKELQQHCPSLDLVASGALAQRICGARSFRKIFALLVLVGRSSDIQSFIREDVADNDLPLHKISRPGSTAFRLGRRGSSDAAIHPLTCFDGWNTNVLWMFEDWQWATLAPTFHGGERKDVSHVDLEDRIPLPFTNDSRYGKSPKTIRGGFSTVFKVDIHPAHHTFRDFKNDDRQSFAVKCLSSIDSAQFDQEVDMLRKFSDNAHPHLISLLATYRQGNKFYLIFPWAEADLRSYWRDVNPKPNMDHDTLLWLGQQCLGIATGLLEIHRHDTMQLNHAHETADRSSQRIRLFGRHGDIKANNILWLRNSATSPTDRGVLKITDFGLAEFQRSASTIYKSPSKVAVSASYRSPECDIKGGRVGQSHDIWALGCLYLELIAWVLGGWELVQKFQKLREAKDSDEFYCNVKEGTFFKIIMEKHGEPVAVVKPAVTKFIEYLHRHQNCTQYLRQFLGLIQTDMLIVKPGNPQEISRIDSGALSRRLRELCQACADTEFALKRAGGAHNE